MAALLKRVLETPDFAAQVTKFACTTISDSAVPGMSTHMQSDFDRCDEIIKRSSKGRGGMMRIVMTRCGNWDALASVLLVCLANLEELEITINGECKHLYTAGAIASAGDLQEKDPMYAGGQFSMSSLRSISFKRYPGAPPAMHLKSDQLIHWLFLPSIWSVSVEDLIYSVDAPMQPIFYPTVKTMSIGFSLRSGSPSRRN